MTVTGPWFWILMLLTVAGTAAAIVMGTLAMRELNPITKTKYWRSATLAACITVACIATGSLLHRRRGGGRAEFRNDRIINNAFTTTSSSPMLMS